jgi:hypothetical protein
MIINDLIELFYAKMKAPLILFRTFAVKIKE